MIANQALTTHTPLEGDAVQRGALRSEADIQSAYSDGSDAARYIDRRFVAPVMRLLHDSQVAAVNAMLHARRPNSTLEIAPGPGRITRHVETIGALTCLEYNAAMLEQARPACRGDIRWVQGNAFELPFKQDFDCVYSFRFIRHFEQLDRSRLYGQIHGVLRPGGLFMMDAINQRVSLPLRVASPQDYTIYDKLYDGLDELRRELAAHDFELVAACPVLRWIHVQSWLQDVVGPRALWLARQLIRGIEAVPSGSPLEWVVTCRRA